MTGTAKALASVLVLLFALLISCSGDGEDDGSQDSTRDQPPTDSSGDGGVAEADTQPPAGGEVQITALFTGFDLPVDIDPIPGQPGRFLLIEQAGLVKLLDAESPDEVDVAADLSDRLDLSANEEGLLGLAFAPDFEESGRVFLYYTAPDPARGVLARFQYEDGALDLDSEELLVEQEQPDVQHNGGGLAFGPDGHLYLGLGDGGPPGSGNQSAQDLSNFLGKVIRVDITEASGYSVPADNPFVGQSGARAEIYAYGFRNPWRFSFDSETGALWLADPGTSAFEEINVVESGGNYGWRITEGFECYEGGECDRSGLTDPVAGYETHDGCAIIGGYVYRGAAIANLQGWYVYANYCQGGPATLLATSTQDLSQTVVVLEDLPVVVGFAEDVEGELMLLSFDGSVYRLEPTQ